MRERTISDFLAELVDLRYPTGMATISLRDTYQFVHRLKEAGLPETQAKVLVEELQEVELEHVATKEDIVAVKEDVRQLEVKLEQMKNSLITWTVSLMLAQVAVFSAITGWLFNLLK